MSSFTEISLTMRDKWLKGTITLDPRHRGQRSDKDHKPEFKFSTPFPEFHIPGELIMKFKTTDNIFGDNINLESSSLFMKSLIRECLFHYEQRKNKLVSGVAI